MLSPDEQLPWFKRRQLVVEAALSLIGLLFILIGLLLQLLQKEVGGVGWGGGCAAGSRGWGGAIAIAATDKGCAG